jgi:hypothetical protein
MPEISEFDHEFMTAGSQSAEGEKLAGLVQQNLTPEEQKRLEEIMPILEEFNLLIFKAQTGEFPEDTEGMGLTNGQGVPEQGMRDTEIAQNIQNQRGVPPRPVEGQVLQNAPEMMSNGGKVVSIDKILQGDLPDWLNRAFNPNIPTLDNKTIFSATDEIDGQQVLYPTVRMVGGELKQLSIGEAKNIATQRKDYIVLPTSSPEEAVLWSKELSNEIGRRRGMALGGGTVPPVIQQQQGPEEVAAGPVGVVAEQGADSSGVADDVKAESDGFVLNAAAVKFAGLKDINDMIQNAKEYAERQGIRLNFGKTPVDAEKILVSNGEVVIPDVLANIIGYDKLEKINNRGKKETEQVEEGVKQEQQVAPPPERPVEQAKPPVLQGKMGGRVKKPKKNLEDQISGLT